nr:cupin domain-containing protein [Leucobacter chinensis]
MNSTDTVALGAHGPKPTAVTEGLTEASLPIWSEGNISTGLWECTEGAFTAFRDGYTEICTIVSGSVTLEAEGEKPWRFGPGDVIVMPSGWKGTWVVHEPLRKHFTIIQDA